MLQYPILIKQKSLLVFFTRCHQSPDLYECVKHTYLTATHENTDIEKMLNIPIPILPMENHP